MRFLKSSYKSCYTIDPSRDEIRVFKIPEIKIDRNYIYNSLNIFFSINLRLFFYKKN